ncbi:DNA-binding protein [Aeropyrum camini]|nr:DNA-binding protein [Aeropyrum camini]
MEELEEILYLMSIRPQYARAIMAGRKKYELRRIHGVPPIEEGSIIVVYASGKVKSIIGEFEARRVIQATPEKIWSIASKPGSGVGEDAWQYIRGAKRAIAIEVGSRRIYERPVTLEEIRRIIPGWNPPFSYTLLEPGSPIYEILIKRLRRRYQQL